MKVNERLIRRINASGPVRPGLAIIRAKSQYRTVPVLSPGQQNNSIVTEKQADVHSTDPIPNENDGIGATFSTLKQVVKRETKNLGS